MIDFILNIVIGYLCLGTLVIPAVYLMETSLINAKDDAFRQWLQSVLGSNSPMTIYKVIMGLLRWPMFVILFTMARIKGKTLFEYMAEGIERHNEELARVRQYTRDVLDGKIPIGRTWVRFELGGTDFIVHFYKSSYLLETIPTHLVVEGDDVATCWRLIDEDFDRNLPLGVGKDLADAQAQCKNDEPWLMLCHPDKREELEQLWSEEKARLTEEFEMNSLVQGNPRVEPD